MITKYIKDDVRNTELSDIAHGVNCQNVMGSGVAKALYEKWPKVKSQFHSISEQLKTPEKRLGFIWQVTCEDKNIWNLYTQLHYLPRNKRNVNYRALSDCFNGLINSGVKKLAIPKIGCGLAGGNWEFVEQLINDTVGDKIEIWVYEQD